ncbi:Translation initiation factor eIF5 [Schizosaccharomyces pombe]|uniref:Probable eukaryotic translation initiation factor 5 n=1 Tax=Schizosaccharomyces pombe (strain 972 / ATCC 24843) TaxID=284812 RepID=IF5_SCHPO|nr:eukaryotic translation initiation factor 5 [Schizosaccharomyces pombe]Q09689.1 RecName: Full=Probable eukaryotic translation initiation factor 5; Short=eIF-5 [Schizosaccharomyces pombe 972h-]CAA90492.1 translation initiation factor eIF5 (predicted) [Schizosaccharomyces pombe]|eukprot:NP_592976.1 eukaryotic translation initiation factor 5 [Schizosaccharomyces pombe]
MATINIRRDVKDSFYRYRMPKLQSKIEGKGNGIKTVIPNMSDIAKALGRPPLYVTKFFGFELGAQTTIIADMDRYIVNGAHDAGKLQDLLDVFIRRFVLCASCQNPETELSINKKDQTISYDCKACGYRGVIDGRHKLTGVIVKNPPAKKKSHKHKRDSPVAEEEDGAEDELTRRIRQEAAELPTAEVVNDEDWAVDTSEEAVRARVQELEGNMKDSLTLSDLRGDEEEAESSRYDQFGEWLEDNYPGVSDVEIYKKMKEENIHHKSKAIVVLVQCIITSPYVGEFEKHGALFKKLCTTDKHERALLGGFERLMENTELVHIDVVPKVLLEIYQNDLVSDDMFEKWGAKASKKYVSRETSKKIHEAAEPFLTWLAEASDESESEDEEEEEEDDDE